MRHALAFVAVAAGLCAASATGQPPPPAASELAGKRFGWTLSGRAAQPGVQCRETWSFGTDGVMTVESGAEVTTKRYALTSVDGSMHALAMTRLTTNGLSDCLGETNAAVGQSNTIHLMFLNGGGFFTCGTTDTLTCYGVATPRP